MRRTWSFVAASALVFSLIAVACSTFTASDAPATPDAGVEASADVLTVETGAEQDGTASDGAAPTVVATSDMNTIVDVRLDGTRVLWTTSQGAPWDVSHSGNLFAATASGSNQALPDGITPFFASAGTPVGSLSGDGTSESAWLSVIGAKGSIALVGSTGFASNPLSVGPLVIRLVKTTRALYWLSRDVQQMHTTVLSLDAGSENTLATANDLSLFDLAVEETSDGTIFYVAGDTGIHAARLGDGTDLLPLVTASDVHSITASTAGLYWAADEGVSYCDVSFAGSAGLTCTKQPFLAPAGDSAVNVTFDHGALFAATIAGSIYECAGMPPCTASPIVQNAPLFDADEYRYGHTMAASATALFWSEGGSGAPHRILRVAR